MVTGMLRELAGPYPPFVRLNKPCSRTVRELIDAWNHVCRQATEASSADELHASRDDYHTLLSGHLKILDGYLMVESRFPHELAESETVERVARARDALQKHYDSLFPRWQTLEDIEAILLERISPQNDLLKALASKNRPPQSWYDETETPAAQE